MRKQLEVWSGGQTGVDRAALDVAMELGIPIGGWVPRGRSAEDTLVPARYQQLREADSAEYAVRTRLNNVVGPRASQAALGFGRTAIGSHPHR